MTQVMDQWSTAKPLLGTLPQWIADEQEKKRIAAYALYEAIYWCVPDTFKTMRRGSESMPIYVPSGRAIVETLHRFMAPKTTFAVDPLFGSDSEKLLATQVMTDLARRERLYSRFNSNKRYGIMRGDWMFHIYADPAKEEGSRISIMGVDPASVFPIYHPDNVDIIIGYHIAEQFLDNNGDPKIRRLTYRKTTGAGGPSPIEVTDMVFEVDDWGGPGMAPDGKPVNTDQILLPTQTLPSPIDQLPIYHIPNFQEPGVIWGSSEMRGVERLLAAINQGISDEELSLALDGLGVWVTDSGTPVNDEGEEIPWNLGPGRVVEIPVDRNFHRESGTSTVAPSQEHLAYLHSVLDEATGMSSIAKGRADVTVAESGIALLIELAPLLAKVEEKEQIVTDVTTNLLFDTAKWYVAYEGTVFNSLMETTRWIPVYGPKIPENRAQSFDQLITIAQAVPQIVPMSYVRDRLRKLGYDDMPTEDQIKADLQVEADATGARADAEVQAELDSGGGAPVTEG